MKRLAVIITITLAFLISSIAIDLFVSFVIANPSPQPSPKVIVSSPIGISNSSNVALDITVVVYGRILYGSEFYIEGIKSLTYSVDRTLNQQVDIPITLTKIPAYSEPEDRYTGNALLLNLSDGTHGLTIQGESTFNNTIYTFVYFTVDTSAPIISIHSPESKTYNSADIQLNYIVNEKSNVSYSLDGQKSLVAENLTLPKLSYGSHNLTVYAIDAAGNLGASETIHFTIPQEIQPELTTLPSEPLPTDLTMFIITGSGISAIILVSICLFYYSRKRKTKNNTVKLLFGSSRKLCHNVLTMFQLSLARHK